MDGLNKNARPTGLLKPNQNNGINHPLVIRISHRILGTKNPTVSQWFRGRRGSLVQATDISLRRIGPSSAAGLGQSPRRMFRWKWRSFLSCVIVNIYVYVYVCMYVCMYVCIYIYICIYVCICIYIYMFKYLYTYIFVEIHYHTGICICIYIYTYICIHSYIYI